MAQRLAAMTKIAQSFTFDSLEFVDGLPDGQDIIYNGFPLDEIQGMTAPEEEKMAKLNERIQRVIFGMLVQLFNQGLPFDAPDVKATKRIDEGTGREILVLFTTL